MIEVLANATGGNHITKYKCIKSICCMCCAQFLSVRLFATLWTATHKAPLSVEFSTQEYWSGLPFPPPVDLPNLRIEPMSLMSPALPGGFFITSATWEAQVQLTL